MLKKTIKAITGPRALKVYHAVKSEAASILAGRPGRGFTVIGVTGTNGKTTTANLIASIFEHAGFKVALLSTIQFRINGKERINETKMTVPEPFAFNRFLRQAKNAGCQILVMEATSIALDQNRTAGLNFDTGVLTNITHDHLDYHGTFDHYVQAKRSLFARGLRVAVLNIDDPNGRVFANLPAAVHFLYSPESRQSGTLYPRNIEVADGITHLEVVLPDGGVLALSTELPGQFNIANILAAVGVGLGHGIAPTVIQAGIKAVKRVPGRMERVEAGQPFEVIIDYAHTPDALQKLYAALAPSKTEGRIISVLGSCGDRDQTKRPILGEIAGREADYVIITNEDPYTEDPQMIIDAVAAGITTGNPNHHEGETYWRVPDRRLAIRKAFGLSRPGDIVTITGKGAETAMMWGTEHRPWSDRSVAEEELRAL